MAIAIGLSVLKNTYQGQDYRECGRLQDGIRKSTTSRPNAGEIGGALLDFSEARLTLELGAVALCCGGGSLEITSIGDPDIIGTAVEDKWLRRA
jgi:hypothetical protein